MLLQIITVVDICISMLLHVYTLHTAQKENTYLLECYESSTRAQAYHLVKWLSRSSHCFSHFVRYRKCIADKACSRSIILDEKLSSKTLLMLFFFFS